MVLRRRRARQTVDPMDGRQDVHRADGGLFLGVQHAGDDRHQPVHGRQDHVPGPDGVHAVERQRGHVLTGVDRGAAAPRPTIGPLQTMSAPMIIAVVTIAVVPLLPIKTFAEGVA